MECYYSSLDEWLPGFIDRIYVDGGVDVDIQTGDPEVDGIRAFDVDELGKLRPRTVPNADCPVSSYLAPCMNICVSQDPPTARIRAKLEARRRSTGCLPACRPRDNLHHPKCKNFVPPKKYASDKVLEEENVAVHRKETKSAADLSWDVSEPFSPARSSKNDEKSGKDAKNGSIPKKTYEDEKRETAKLRDSRASSTSPLESPQKYGRSTSHSDEWVSRQDVDGSWTLVSKYELQKQGMDFETLEQTPGTFENRQAIGLPEFDIEDRVGPLSPSGAPQLRDHGFVQWDTY